MGTNLANKDFGYNRNNARLILDEVRAYGQDAACHLISGMRLHEIFACTPLTAAQQ